MSDPLAWRRREIERARRRLAGIDRRIALVERQARSGPAESMPRFVSGQAVGQTLRLLRRDRDDAVTHLARLTSELAHLIKARDAIAKARGKRRGN